MELDLNKLNKTNLNLLIIKMEGAVLQVSQEFVEDEKKPSPYLQDLSKELASFKGEIEKIPEKDKNNLIKHSNIILKGLKPFSDLKLEIATDEVAGSDTPKFKTSLNDKITQLVKNSGLNIENQIGGFER